MIVEANDDLAYDLAYDLGQHASYLLGLHYAKGHLIFLSTLNSKVEVTYTFKVI